MNDNKLTIIFNNQSIFTFLVITSTHFKNTIISEQLKLEWNDGSFYYVVKYDYRVIAECKQLLVIQCHMI